MAFEQLRKSELLQEAKKERDIVEAFMPQQEGFRCHPAAVWNSKKVASAYAKAGLEIRCGDHFAGVAILVIGIGKAFPMPITTRTAALNPVVAVTRTVTAVFSRHR